MNIKADDLIEMTDNTLLTWWLENYQAYTAAAKIRWLIEAELQQRMEGREASVISNSSVEARLDPDNAWDDQRLLPLLERDEIPDHEMQRGYTAPYHKDILVPAKFDMRIVRPWKKYGKIIENIIDSALLPSRSKIKVKPL
jgi:hypothetical protein